MKNKLQNQMPICIKGFLSLLLLVVACTTGFSQNVGISPTGATLANAAAGLDVNFTDKGLLVPRIALTGSTSFSPLGSTHVAGMIVYNTATISDVIPGLYYDNGTKWIPVFPSVAGAGLLYWNGTSWVPVLPGVAGQKLQLVAGIPTWVP